MVREITLWLYDGLTVNDWHHDLKGNEWPMKMGDLSNHVNSKLKGITDKYNIIRWS